MRSYLSIAVATIVAAGLVPAVADAHHSAAMFDLSRSTSVSGTVRVFQWTNPHAWLWLTVPDANGTTRDVGVEFGALAILRRTGLDKDSFKPGEKAVVEIHPLKSGEPGGSFMSAMVDGRLVKAEGPNGK